MALFPPIQAQRSDSTLSTPHEWEGVHVDIVADHNGCDIVNTILFMVVYKIDLFGITWLELLGNTDFGCNELNVQKS